MSLEPISYNRILAIADMWRDMGGSSEIEIGALEPLLWNDGQYRIHDVVSALTELGFNVSMTTNGQLLDVFAESLKHAGLSLIRTSWHSTNPLIFKEISGGYGDYNRFMRGITLALELGIKVVFNRVLLKGHINDIPKQLSFIKQHKSRLKLYTLLWTPQNAPVYSSFYQDWRPVVRSFILSCSTKIIKIRKCIGRKRLRFNLAGGGSVEVKLGDRLIRNLFPCVSCQFKEKCEEKFGDYVRIDHRSHLYFCYIRRDLGFQIFEFLKNPKTLNQKIKEVFGDTEINNFLSSTPLRFTLTPFCNFNCRIPGMQQGWCMEEPGEYIYPKIRASLLKKE